MTSLKTTGKLTAVGRRARTRCCTLNEIRVERQGCDRAASNEWADRSRRAPCCAGSLKVSLVRPVATNDKFGRLKQLMEVGKEKGFVLYDEVNELLAEEFPSGREFEDLLTDLDSAGVEILEEPKLDFEKSKEEPEDFGDLELTQETGDKTNDPVRMYLREMGTVPLLTREGEIELAKRNERGQWAVRKALSRSRAGDPRDHSTG